MYGILSTCKSVLERSSRPDRYTRVFECTPCHLFIHASPYSAAPISPYCPRCQATHAVFCSADNHTLISIGISHRCTMSIRALRRQLASSTGRTHAAFSSLPHTSGTRRERLAAVSSTLALLATDSATATAAASSSATQQQLAAHDQHVANLLHAFLSQPCHQRLLAQLREQLASPILASIRAAYCRASNADKKQLSSLVTPHYSRGTLHALGFPISAASYSTGRRHAEQHHPGALAPPPLQPASKRPATPQTLAVLSSFLDQHSQLAACRTVKVDGVHVPARILQLTYSELHRGWQQQHSGVLRSQSAFNAAIKALRVYKRVSKRSTDMCDHCMEGQRHQAALDRQLLQHRSTCMFAFTVRQQLLLMQSTSAVPPATSTVQAAVESSPCRCDLLQPTDVNATLALLPIVCFYLHHRSIKQQVASEYKRQQASLQPGHVIITLDYKENIKVNTAPDEASRVFYHQSQRTVLGFLLQYINPSTGRLHNHYVDIISSSLTHDATFALECLQRVIQLHVLPHALHTVHVWCDSGRHFRCSEFAAGVTCTLPALHRTHRLSTHLHYFAEKHGKSAVDGHFSLLSRWLKQAAAQQQILTTSQLIDALRQQAASHLLVDRRDGMPTHAVTFMSYNPPCQQHAVDEHDRLIPAPTNALLHSSPSMDGDGDVCMQPSASSSVSAAAAVLCDDCLDDDGDVAMAATGHVTEYEEAQTVESDAGVQCASAVSLSDSAQSGGVIQAQPVRQASSAPSYSVSDQRHCSRLEGEGRVSCVRPATVIPSLRLPDTSTGLSTHYYFHAPTPPHFSASENYHSTGVPVSLHVAVVRNSVWPVQSVQAKYSATTSSVRAIAFAPRLQESPQIVVHPHSMGAMQRRLTAVRRVFPQLRACEAASVIDSIARLF